MKVTDFAKVIAEQEGKKKQVSIAQIKEILKDINSQLDGELYRLIKNK